MTFGIFFVEFRFRCVEIF